MAPVLILGGMRAGWFTPTEAAVVAVVYGLFVGFVVYRSLTLRDLYEMLVESAEITGIILIIVALASIFGWAGATLGVFDKAAQMVMAFGSHEYVVLALLIAILIAPHPARRWRRAPEPGERGGRRVRRGAQHAGRPHHDRQGGDRLRQSFERGLVWALRPHRQWADRGG